MKQLFLDLEAKLLTLLNGDQSPTLKYVRMWNNQLKLVEMGKMELFQHPACFISFVTGQTNNFLGGEGVQLYDPLIIELHILDWQVDAGDGTFAQNLEVFDLKQRIYQLMQKFKASKASPMIRIAESQDYEHAGVYHFIQTYQTTYIDDSMQEPVNGDSTNIPLPLEVDLTVDQSADSSAPHIYTKTLGLYQYDNSLGGNPASGFLQLNNATPSAATLLLFNDVDKQANNLSSMFASIANGSTIKISKDVSNYWIVKVVSSTSPTLVETDFVITFVSGLGTISNNDIVTILIS
jgi:hypothetical protein